MVRIRNRMFFFWPRLRPVSFDDAGLILATILATLGRQNDHELDHGTASGSGSALISSTCSRRLVRKENSSVRAIRTTLEFWDIFIPNFTKGWT
jgi:hypothetical protein